MKRFGTSIVVQGYADKDSEVDPQITVELRFQTEKDTLGPLRDFQNLDWKVARDFDGEGIEEADEVGDL